MVVRLSDGICDVHLSYTQEMCGVVWLYLLGACVIGARAHALLVVSRDHFGTTSRANNTAAARYVDEAAWGPYCLYGRVNFDFSVKKMLAPKKIVLGANKCICIYVLSYNKNSVSTISAHL